MKPIYLISNFMKQRKMVNNSRFNCTAGIKVRGIWKGWIAENVYGGLDQTHLSNIYQVYTETQLVLRGGVSERQNVLHDYNITYQIGFIQIGTHTLSSFYENNFWVCLQWMVPSQTLRISQCCNALCKNVFSFWNLKVELIFKVE